MGTEVNVVDHRDHTLPFVTISAAGDEPISFTVGLDPEAAEAVTEQLVKLFPQEPAEFDPIDACEEIARYLLKRRKRTSPGAMVLVSDEELAMAVLRRALRLAEQDEEHDTLTEAGI